MIYFIYGILLWQLICFITLWISNENDEAQAYVSCGVFLVVENLFMKFIGRPIYLLYCRKYNLYNFYPSLTSKYMTQKCASQFKTKTDGEYYITLIREGKDFKSAPYKEDIIKYGEKPRGMTWEYFNNWKKGED